jgi:exonuclease III/ribonuclease HI
MTDTINQNRISAGRCPQGEDGSTGTRARSAVHEQGVHSINIVNTPLGAGTEQTRPAPQDEQGTELRPSQQNRRTGTDHNGGAPPAGAQGNPVADDDHQPPRDDGDAGMVDWGENINAALDDDEINEEELRAEWIAENEPPTGHKKTKASILVASCNMKGRGEIDHLNRPSANNKWLHINQIMRERKIGILALQETHMTNELEARIDDLFGKRLKTVHSTDANSPNSKGVALVINKELLNTEDVKTKEIVAGRALVANIPWHNGEKLTVLTVYAPNRPDENRDFWNTISEKWENMRLPRPDLMLGDFNFVEAFIDRLPAHDDRPDIVQAFNRLKSSMKLADGWRLLNPGARNYTYLQAQSEGRPQSRLDRIYASSKVIQNSQEWSISPTGGILTDHWMVAVRVLSEDTPFQGPGRWSLPLYLLRDKKTKHEISERATKLGNDIDRAKYRRSAETNPQTLYKTFKRELAEFGRQRAKETMPAHKKSIEQLILQREKLANDPRLTPGEKKDAIIAITEQINEKEEKRHSLARTSTSARDALEGERITRYWSAVNAPAKRTNTIRNLRRPDGQGLEARSDLMAEIARKHHNDVQYEEPAIDQITREAAIRTAHSKIKRKLTNAQKAKMAKRITENDVEKAIRAAPPGKAAGLDGLPAELWKELLNEYCTAEKQDPKPSPMPPNIAKILTCVYNDIEEHGIEPGTEFNEGWMCPIFKKNERSEIANYRPITVLNTDYKIMTKAITMRLTTVIDDLIEDDQAGFIPKRSIFDQVKLAKLTLRYAEATETNGAIVALDQEKAYDKIAHDYLWRTLIEFNLPQNFVNTVIRLYTNAHTSVMVNGVLSQAFRITRGVRQGDPLSCLLFNLAIEPLACLIRQSTLKGLSVPGREDRLIVKLFADDTTVYLNSEDDLNDLYEILENWCRASKAKFNISKTEVVPIGMPGYRTWVREAKKLHGTHDEVGEPMKFSRDREPVRLLGAWIGNNIDSAVPWGPVVEKIERSLDRWDKSHPSTEGRRLIIQMVIGGTTQYLAKVQEMPEHITKRLTNTMWEFIWDGNPKNAPVNRETMHAPLLEGGKKILDIQARNEAIQLTWLQSYLTIMKRPTWAYFADALFWLAAPLSGRIIEETAATNPFLQNWRPKTAAGTTLPQELASMVRTAEKHGVKIDGISMGEEVRKEMPIWLHTSESTYMRRVTNRPAAKCLRNKHKVKTTGQMMALTERNEAHTDRPSCACNVCASWRGQGCQNPQACRELADKFLTSMPDRWHPRERDGALDLILTEEENENNDKALGKGEDVTFERRLTVEELQDTFRVFAPKRQKEYHTPERMVPREPPGPTNEVWTASISRTDDNGATKTAAVIWFDRGDERNTTFLVTGKQASRQRGEILAIIEALRTAPRDQPLRIISANKQTVEYLTTKLRSLEDKGWVSVKHGDVFRKAAAWLKSRLAKTFFKVRKIAKRGRAESDILNELNTCLETSTRTIDEPEEARGYDVEGAKLLGLSQSEMYRHIVQSKRKENSRRRTDEMIARVKADRKAASGSTPETEMIWKSVRDRDFSRSQRTFKWRAIHDAYKVGAYWNAIPNYEERARCPICDEEESIEHILLKCKSPTRRAIKKAEKNLWRTRTNIAFPMDNLGTRLGAGLVHFGKKKGTKKHRGLERFWRIIQSETDQVIWTLRCEARIARGDRPEERHTIPEALNRWWAAIERRLSIERISTDKKRFGKIAMDRQIVRETWREAIEQITDQDEWIEQGGVLVGRRQHR